MKLEETNTSGIKYVIADDGRLVAIYAKKGDKLYCIKDRVKVKADHNGYVAPYITYPGEGTIISIARSELDYYFGVRMDNGETDTVDIKKVRPLMVSSTVYDIKRRLYAKRLAWQVELDDIRAEFSDLAKRRAWSSLFARDKIVELYGRIISLKREDFGQWDIPELASAYNHAFNDINWAFLNCT